MAKRDDLTLDEALSDPLILALMRADRADPLALRRDWQTLAERFTGREVRDGGAEGSSTRFSAEGEVSAWRGMIEDCLCASRAKVASRRDGRGAM